MSEFKKLPAHTRMPATAHHVMGTQLPDTMRRPLRRGPRGTLEENPALGDEIVQYVRDGMFLREATSMAGIHKATVYDWVKRGRIESDAGEDTVYASFYIGLQQALAEAKYDSVTAIRRAGQNPAFWMAAAWYLERRYPQEFGKQDRLQLQHSGAVGSATIGIQAALNDDESRKALADVATILAKSGIGIDQSTSTSDSDDEWQDGESTTFGLIE